MEMGLVQMGLMLLQQSRNSLASQARRVNSVVRGRGQQRGNHSSNVAETRGDGCSDTSSGTIGRAATPLFCLDGAVHRDLVTPSRASQYCYAAVCAHTDVG